jgi:alanine racemase
MRVSADALRANYARIQARVGPGVGIVPMVKADAYGLGITETVRALAPAGPLAWGVATLEEGVRLRALGVREPVIVFCPLPEASLEAALAAGLDVSVSSLEGIEQLASAARRTGSAARMHVDVDTGMGRSGLDWRLASDWLPCVTAADEGALRWIGIFTHLHSADEDDASVREQWARFQGVLGALASPPAGLLVHVLNSAGVFRAPEYALAAVRPGVFLYGGEVGSGQPAPEPVVTLHTRVVYLRKAEPGTTVGYGATYRAERPEQWATLSIGYGDGLPRSLGNRGSALIGGRRVPIIGRISMDLTVVDITGVQGVRVGDVATLVGTEGSESITVDEVAALAGTISYEVLVGFTPRLPRVWTGLDGS